MEIEAVVLTGGKSERMGSDKSEIEVDGVPTGLRTARALSEIGVQVTVLGRQPIESYPFLADEAEFQGPLAALSRFAPKEEMVFVASCDMPKFDASILRALQELIGKYDAAVPLINGELQPTCALYNSRSFFRIREAIQNGRRSLMAWLDILSVRSIDATELLEHGLDPNSLRGANTPEEFRAITDSA